MLRPAILSACALLFSLALGAVPCTVLAQSAGDASRAFYEEALDKLADDEPKVAEILLRNALQQDPENLAARITLGTTVLKLGQPRLAISELEEALRQGGDQNLILPALAHAYIAILEPESVITKILPDRTHQFDVAGEIYLARGEAFLMLGAKDKAGDAFAEASVRLPTDHRPTLGLARIAMIERRYKKALDMMEKAVLLNPEAADAWAFQAKALRDLRQYKAAIASYDRAIALDAETSSVYASRAAMWVDLGQYDRARKDVEQVKRLGVDDLQTIYLQTLLLFGEGKVEEARSLLRTTAVELHEIPDKLKDKLPNTRLMLGIISYFNGNYDTALLELTRYLDRIPNHLGAKRYLASSYLALRDWDNVIRTYQVSFRDPVPRDPVAISLIAEAYRQKGRYRQAEELYETALRISPKSAGLALKLAQSRLDAGDVAKARGDIQSLVDRFPELTEAHIQLARVHVRLGELDAAMAIARDLVARHPEDPNVQIMLAATYMATESYAEAERALLEAWRLDPDMIQPQLNLGRLAVKRGDVASAESRFRTVLESHQNNLDAGQALVDLLLARGELGEAKEKVEAMLQFAPDALQLHILKLKLGLRTARDEAGAKGLIYDFGAKFSRNADALAVAARASIVVGDNAGAGNYFRRSAEYAGYNEKLLLLIAQGQIKLEDYEAALWTIEKAGAANPENVYARATKINLLRIVGELDRAEDTLAESDPAMRGDYQMLMSAARLHRSRGRHGDALNAFTAAAERNETSEATRAIFQMRQRIGDQAQAYQGLQTWVAQHPRDLTSRHLLADHYMQAGRYEEAQAVYEALLADDVKSIIVLNNLATIYHRLGDDRALASAQVAYELAPENPLVIDTYGWILIEQGEPEKALPLLREAYARSATNLTIRYHIGLALARLGRNEQAVKELQATLATGVPFRESEEAKELLASLKKG